MNVLRPGPQPRSARPSAGLVRTGLATAVALALLAPAAAAPQERIAPSAARQIASLLAEKAGRTPAQKKISTRLLFEIKRQRDDPTLAGLPVGRSRLQVDGKGRVLVDLKGEVSDRLLARIEQLGGRVINHHQRFDAVRAELPLASVETLAERPELRSIRPAGRFMTQAVVTEGDVAHKADLARAATGADGTGVKVCAISDSVDELAALIASEELPPGTTFLPGQDGVPDSSEGTALLEIIHDIAPAAELLFATAKNSEAQFAQNILDLQAAGCHVIVDDALYFAEGVFQDGVVAQAVETVAAQGVIYFSAAGNSGNENDGTSGVYEGDFVGMAVPPPIGAPPGFLAHDFSGTGVALNAVTEQALNPAPFFTLQWADPLDGSGNDYDLFLLNFMGTVVEAFSINVQDGDDDPYEEIVSLGDDSFKNLVVVKRSGAADRFIHVNTHRGRLLYSTNGQIFGHPAARNAIAVAAVGVSTAGGAGGVFDGTESVEEFSSDGPRRIYFEADGSPVPATLDAAGPGGSRGVSEPYILRQKPDVAAADGVSVTTPFFTPFFFGTSAAAPHAAGIAALLIDELDALMFDELLLEMLPPIQSVPQMRGLFDSTSLDIEDPGFDEDSGAGILDASGAINDQGIFADGFESGDVSAWTSDVP